MLKQIRPHDISSIKKEKEVKQDSDDDDYEPSFDSDTEKPTKIQPKAIIKPNPNINLLKNPLNFKKAPGPTFTPHENSSTKNSENNNGYAEFQREAKGVPQKQLVIINRNVA